MTFNEEKFKELLLYVCQKLEDKPNYGSVLLNKALYLIDNMYYLKYHKSITGIKYIKQNQGPTPQPAIFLRIRDNLINQGAIEEKQNDYFGHIQKRFIAKHIPNTTIFDKKELSLINHVIEMIADLNAKDISNITHDLNWELADKMEEIPYYTFWIGKSELREEDILWAKKSIKEYEQEINTYN